MEGVGRATTDENQREEIREAKVRYKIAKMANVIDIDLSEIESICDDSGLGSKSKQIRENMVKHLENFLVKGGNDLTSLVATATDGDIAPLENALGRVSHCFNFSSPSWLMGDLWLIRNHLLVREMNY